MKSLDEFDADPVIPDVCDPETQEEIFLILKMQHFALEDLLDRDLAVLYARWLERTEASSAVESQPSKSS